MSTLLTITCNPKYPPQCLKTLILFAEKRAKQLHFSVHIHSDILCQTEQRRKDLLTFFSSFYERNPNQINQICLIWKNASKYLLFIFEKFPTINL